ncbi:hypothetical protein PNOK_0675000 [Pyrrhoderma noxium]|uniref:Uncharacterized protein n=1 Tax=Pyrrhoderma noxium TaxID=2282107 RepID=A0A286UFJ3_9AGAM|nr:hypothetical protein PNOK_0675000 [Pyrrhoderma noxium]
MSDSKYNSLTNLENHWRGKVSTGVKFKSTNFNDGKKGVRFECTFGTGANAKTCVKSDRTNDPLKKKLQNLNQRLEEYVNTNNIGKK